MQWKMTIDSWKIKYFDFSSYCQGDVQPRNSHRLGLVRDGVLVCHNRQAFGRQREEARGKPEKHIPDRGIGPSGAQLLSNLRLTRPALSMQSILRDSLVHLNINGCQSINKSSIDILLRLSHLHLPKLQRINMTGLQLELCQQAAKSFLREKLGALDSIGTMGPQCGRVINTVGEESTLRAKNLRYKQAFETVSDADCNNLLLLDDSIMKRPSQRPESCNFVVHGKTSVFFWSRIYGSTHCPFRTRTQ